MTTQERIEALFKEIDESLLSSIKYVTRRKAFFEQMRPLLDRVPEDFKAPEFCGMWVDFNYLSHEEAVQLMLLFPGKWAKSYDSDAITYTQEIGDSGGGIRIYRGSPPPNCTIIEEEVEIPAQPARKEMRRKIKCNTPANQPWVESEDVKN